MTHSETTHHTNRSSRNSKKSKQHCSNPSTENKSSTYGSPTSLPRQLHMYTTPQKQFYLYVQFDTITFKSPIIENALTTKNVLLYTAQHQPAVHFQVLTLKSHMHANENRNPLHRCFLLAMTSLKNLLRSARTRYTLTQMSLWSLAVGPIYYDFSLFDYNRNKPVGRLSFCTIFSHCQNIQIGLENLQVNVFGEHQREELFASLILDVMT